jgi:Tfp pilus assembly protein PilN
MAKQDTITATLLCGTQLEWTTLHRRKNQWERVAQQRVELPVPADADAATKGAAIKQAMGGIKGRHIAVAHTDQCLLRVVDLPATAAEDLDGMVELQVDKFSPFPAEHMAVGYENLAQTGANSLVLIAAARVDGIQALGDVFQAAGALPDGIDVAVGGWWYALRNAAVVSSEGRHGVLLIEETGAELLITENGSPLMVRSLGLPHAESHAAYYEEVAEETAYALTSLESEWGARLLCDLTVWHRGEVPTALVDCLQAQGLGPISMRKLDELPFLTEGVARRAVAGSTLDLALPAWREAISVRANRRRTITIASFLLVIWLAGLGTLLGVTARDRARIAQLQQQNEVLTGPVEEARALRHRVESLEQYGDRTHSALEILREVSALMPGGLELSSFSYRKGGAVNVRGQSVLVPPIYDFFDAMERSPLFVEVTPEGVTVTPGGRRNPDFRLTARLPGGELE